MNVLVRQFTDIPKSLPKIIQDRLLGCFGIHFRVLLFLPVTVTHD